MMLHRLSPEPIIKKIGCASNSYPVLHVCCTALPDLVDFLLSLGLFPFSSFVHAIIRVCIGLTNDSAYA